jgi:hypothetical protein
VDVRDGKGTATTRATGSQAFQHGKALKDALFEKCVAIKELEQIAAGAQGIAVG